MAGQSAALTGLSGSVVQAVVHKFPAGPGAEARQKFWGEIGKQQVLAHLGVGPPVLRATHYEYVRPYVPGITLEAYLEVHPEEAEERAHELLRLCGLLQWGAGPGASEPFIPYARRLVREYTWPYVPASLSACYSDLLAAMERVTWPDPVFGFSHGDLNFENIIVDPDGRLHLIDPLLNSYDTPWWDIAKLLQSTYVYWAFLRRGVVTQPPGHLLQMAEILLAGKRWALFFLFLALLRILRHAPSDDIQLAVLTEAFRVGWKYVCTS